MFDNFLTKVRSQASTISENLRSRTTRLSGDLDAFKNKFVKNTKVKHEYVSVQQSDDYLAPRACTNFEGSWPALTNGNMEWVPYVPPGDDNSIIERFIRVVTLNDDERRTDREEIRRRLAMGSEEDYYNGSERPGRKPSLQARLQSGMNLQICFMNETASDTDSPNSDTECSVPEAKQHGSLPAKVAKAPQPQARHAAHSRPVSLPLSGAQPLLQPFSQPLTEADFFERQARLQTEARMALAQAKEMAHMQMEVERQRQKKSPITEMVRSSLEKVGIPFPEERRRVSRQILTEMNVAQLQVIVNDLHTQIETLNENLVRFLMDRDDLHMEQDSMLVDIEDLTRYLGAKEQTVKEAKLPAQNNNLPPPSPAPATPLAAINNTVKPRLHRIASFVKK